MIKIRLICVGNLKETYLKDAVSEYEKRMSKYCSFELIELSEAKSFSKTSVSEIEQIKQIEGKCIFNQLKGFVVCLCVNGKNFSSEQFADKIKALTDSGVGEISFVIGGSYGLSDEVISKSDLKLSFSSFTFPHQLMRVIFMEQIYRAFNIIAGSSYHK